MNHIDRRAFLKAGSLLGISTMVAGELLSAEAGASSSSQTKGAGKVPFKKATITGVPDEALLTELKAVGFDGVEVNLMGVEGKILSREEGEKVRQVADRVGMKMHSVMRGWAEYNSSDPAKVKADHEYTIATMYAAQGLGAEVILLVPGRVGGMKMPERDQYRLKFDQTTGHVTAVVEGDNAPYQEYIDAQNKAYDAFQVKIPELIPVAEKTGVVVAIENVWNHLFISPEYFAFFIDSFKSKWIQGYFDVANHLAYGPPPQDWIRVLGKRIHKIHIKDYKLNPTNGDEWPSLREGSVEFPKVIQALTDIGYTGWLTIEGPCGDHKECSRRLDTIIQGT
jgi:hexulose-6-phosphate isomerase